MELRQRSGTHCIPMDRREVVDRESRDTVGDGPRRSSNVAKAVKVADVEISKEGRDARVKKAPQEPSVSEVPSRSACIASRAKEDPHWRKWTEDVQENGTTRLTQGSSATTQQWRRLLRVSVWRSTSLARVCSSHEQSIL